MVLNKRALQRVFSPTKVRRQVGHGKIQSRTQKGGNPETSNMRVVVRIRPENPNEIEKNCRSIVKEVDDKTLIFDPVEDLEPFFYHGTKQTCRDIQKKQNKELSFVFDRVFGCESTNDSVFEGTTKDIVKCLLDGYNCSVFAYGATGAGKTFTMLGNKNHPGITYLTIVELYQKLEELKESKEFQLAVSHLEVYNENVQDLIKPSGPLHLREDVSSGVRIPGLSIHQINNADELFTLMEQGNRNRTQHPTDANAESSRSHSVFQLYIRMTNKLDKNMKIMKLSMIDLAGSERGSATGCKGVRFTEGTNINRSLLALGNCINSLADGLKHIPYRDSKLTRLLKDSLGGNSQTVMIANISPSSNSYEDTYNTLKYATRAKKIRQLAKKNVISVQLHASEYEKVVETLTAEIEKLKLKVKECEKEHCVKNMPTEVATVVSLESPQNIATDQSAKGDELLTQFEEMRCLKKEILKLGKELKILKIRTHFKRKAAERVSYLSLNPTALNQRLNRIKASILQFRGRAETVQERLKEIIAKWNEQYLKKDCLVKNINTNEERNLKHHMINSELLEQLQDREMQLEHCQQLIALQHNELQSQDMIIKDLCHSLKSYHLILKGNNSTTEAMSLEFEELVRKLEGMRTISWEKDGIKDINIKNITDLSIHDLLEEKLPSVELDINCEIETPLNVPGPHTSDLVFSDSSSKLNGTFVMNEPKSKNLMIKTQVTPKVSRKGSVTPKLSSGKKKSVNFLNETFNKENIIVPTKSFPSGNKAMVPQFRTSKPLATKEIQSNQNFKKPAPKQVQSKLMTVKPKLTYRLHPYQI